MEFGLSTHLYHGERLAPAHFQAMAAAGFTLVEIFATRTHFDYTDRARVDEARRWADQAGVTPRSLHLPISTGVEGGVWGRPFSNASPDAAVRREAIDETVMALHAAAALGCATAVLHLGVPHGVDGLPGDNDAGALAKSLSQVVEAADAAAVTLAIEVIPNALSTPEALADLLDRDEFSRAGVCLDVGHAHLMGGAPDAAELLAGHLATTHIHDNHGREDEHLVPFAGTIDWPATLMALSKAGYQGPLILEVDAAGDAEAVLARSIGARTRLQAILDELNAPMF